MHTIITEHGSFSEFASYVNATFDPECNLKTPDGKHSTNNRVELIVNIWFALL